MAVAERQGGTGRTGHTDRPGQRGATGASGRAGHPGRRAGARPSGRLLRVCRTVAVTASAAVLLTAGVSWYSYRQLTTGVRTSDVLSMTQRNAPAQLDNSVNLLLIGLDSRKDMNGNDLPSWVVRDELQAGSSSDVGGYNTNSLIVIHIPAGGKAKAQAFSIPRDDYVMTYNGDGTQQGMHKIKEAYGLAKAASMAALEDKGYKGAQLEQASREVGRAATITTVQKFLNLRIDHFAEVNLIGFYDIAQAIGPINVCLKNATSDPAMNGQGSGANFHAGINTLSTPAEALAFVRQRHNLTDTEGNGNGGDFARTHRQQAFIASAEIALKQQGVLGDVSRMQSLFDVVKKDIVIDDQWNLLDFAQQAPNLSGGNVVFNTLPVAALKSVYIPGEGTQDVNFVSVHQVQSTVQALIDQDPAPSASAAGSAAASAGGSGSTPVAQATVDVFNGSGVTGGAAAESAVLAAAGYTKGQISTHAPAARTRVLYGAGAAEAGKQIAAKLGVAAPVASSEVTAGHVAVILGTGFTLPSAPVGGAPSSGGSVGSGGGGSGGSGSGGSGSGGSAAPSPSGTANLVFQGSAVQGGGIPCVE